VSSFVGLFTGLSGVRVGQTGVDLASHNVANANTPGYTRQRLDLAPRPTYQAPAGRMGTGVDVQSITRLRDAFLDDRFRAAVGDHAFGGVRADLLGRMEALTGEPDEGLSVRIGRLWSAAEAWANDPADVATRRQVLNELGSIAEGFRTTAAAWDALAADAGARRDTVVESIDHTLAVLQQLDDRLANADPSRVGSDLLDQRDRLLDTIAQQTGATVRIGADGRSQVTLGGLDLVSPAGASTLSVVGNDIRVTGPDGTTTTVPVPVRGELGGLHQALTVDVPAWQAQLDQLASDFAAEIHAINAAGVRADGSPGGALFGAAGSAATIVLQADDVADLAAAVAGSPPATHDGSNARRLADLRTGSFVAPGSGTIEQRLADVTVGLAGEVRANRIAADASRSIATGAELARAAQHGVSLDEEMVDLVRYQRALESASRVMTTVDEMLDVLINRTGIVGR
jgi:flagellar hook-associated protein 1 FlgK